VLVGPLEFELNLLMKLRLVLELVEILQNNALVILGDLFLLPQLHQFAFVVDARGTADRIPPASIVSILFIKHQYYYKILPSSEYYHPERGEARTAMLCVN
jgi:hypothetical protein